MTSGTAAHARYTGPKRRQCEPRRLRAFQYVYCARLVSAVSVMAKLRLCEKAFAPADAVTPSIPASRSGQHQLPTARPACLFHRLRKQTLCEYSTKLLSKKFSQTFAN